MESAGTKFWDQSPTMWDDVNNVGLRYTQNALYHIPSVLIPQAIFKLGTSFTDMVDPGLTNWDTCWSD